MIIKLLVFLLATASWIAAIWLLIQPDFSRWPEAGIILLHAVPPLSAWLFWMWFLRRRQKRKEIDAKARAEQEQADRKAALEEAQKKHAEEIRQRRFACDCRAVAISGLTAHADVPLVETDMPHIDIEHRSSDASETTPVRPVLDGLTPSIADALSKLYLACRASAVFPIFVAPPSDASGEEVLARIRAIHAELVGTLDTGISADTGSPSILFLPARDCAANSVISLFESTPDLPGAIVLAFDSPLLRSLPRDEFDIELSPEQLDRERRVGKPGEGVIAMLLTNAELPSMLAAIANIEIGKQDSMTPYWEKSLQPGGHLALLVAANNGSRSELAQLPVLGRIHRASFRQAPQPRTGVLELTKLVQDALERAQINAGLIDPPFRFESDSADDEKKNHKDEGQASRCSWIVHNAGGVELAGKRLAALGSSLYYFGIDLSPVDAATSTNIVTRIGDLGRATPIGQLALGVAQAAKQSGPVLCAEYTGDDGIAMSFIRPAQAG